MHLALYGPGGYYASKNRVGSDGDFYTAPAVHPAFGALIATQIHEIWEDWGHRGQFDVVELGSGRGTLAFDILLTWKTAAPDLYEAAAFRVVDHLDPEVPGTRFHPASQALPEKLRGVVIANEFFDALPVHRVVRQNGEIREQYVTAQGDGFEWQLGPLSSETLAAFVAPWAGGLPEGTIAEAQLEAQDRCVDLARKLAMGVALIVDYGADRKDLLTRPTGTLRGFRRHRLLTDPFAFAGEMDLTSHVDFESLRTRAKAEGMNVLGEVDQATFLENLGIGAIMRSLERADLLGDVVAANRAALADLVAPSGFGRYRVLGLGKHYTPKLSGFGDRKTRRTPLCAPLLTRRHIPLWGNSPNWAQPVQDARDVLDGLFPDSTLDFD